MTEGEKREYSRAYYAANKEKWRARYEANKEKIRAYNAAHYRANFEANKEKRRAYYEANKEKKREYMRAYNQLNREEISARRKIARVANREKLVARSRAYYKKNREVIRAKIGKFYRENVPKKMCERAAARAKQRGLPFSLCPEDIFIPPYCPVCAEEMRVNDGKQPGDRRSPTLDRILPGLGYIKHNIIVVCHRCNSIKNDASVAELRRVADFYEKLIADRGLKEE